MSMASEAAIAAPIASPIWSLKYGKCHLSGDSTTPSSDTNSDATTFLIGTSSDSIFQPNIRQANYPRVALLHIAELRPNDVPRRSRRRENVPVPAHPRKAEVRVLRGGLALDALYLLARDVDRAGELVGLEHPAFHHILDLPRSEAEILGRLHHGDFLAFFVFHPTNLLARQRRGPGHPIRIHWPFFLPLFTALHELDIVLC